MFRAEAAAHNADPEDLDQLVRLTNPAHWLALLSLGGLMFAGLLWTLFGHVPTTMRADGVLVHSGGVTTVPAPAAGVVQTWHVRAGDPVQAGQPLATVTSRPSSETSSSEVASPVAGRVVEVEVIAGGSVDAGAPLLTIEPLDSPLELVLYVPLAKGEVLRPDMTVRISPEGEDAASYGYLRGRISSVPDFPASSAELKRTLGSEELVRTFSSATAPLEIHVALEPGATPSGYRWSTPRGSPTALKSGLLCSASVVLSERSLLQLGR